jgi:hypothetical protein
VVALDDLDRRDGGLTAWLVENRKSPLAKRVLAALQEAEEAGVPTDQQAVLKILQTDKPNTEKLQEAADEINRCHK